MKMSYEKPRMEIETFALNAAVASCNRLPAGTEYQYTPQTVACVVTTSDVIFTANTSGCDHEVDPTVTDGSTYRFTTYNGQLYFCWKNSSMGGGQPDDDAVRTLQAICASAGIDNAQGWHAGPANATLIQLYSHSF